MALFKILRGNKNNLPTEKHDGYAYFCTDTKDFYIDYKDSNNEMQRTKISSDNAEKLRYIKDGVIEEITPETLLENFVAKETGKGLSTNDYTTEEKDKLAGLAAVATSGSYNDLSDTPEIDRTLSVTSTDESVPSSKCVYDAIRSAGVGSGGNGSSVQSDYEQNDSVQPDYIKNRTHYKEVIHQEEVELLPATEIDFPSLGDAGYTQSEPLSIQAGDTVKVLWDNQEYECEAQLIPPAENLWPTDMIGFGNLAAFEIDDPDTYKIPFAVVSNYSFGEEGFIAGCIIMPLFEVSNPITVKIFTEGDKVIYHKLDVNYLPISNSTISKDDNTIVTSKPLLNYLRANRPDYEVSDSDDPRFIKNRLCYRSLWGTSAPSLINTTITLDENGLYTSSDKLFSFDYIWDNSYDDINLTVYWHDGTYNCKLRRLYTDWVDEFGDQQYLEYFVFGNVSDIDYDYRNDTAPFLIYADYNPDTHENNATYIKAYDGFTGEITLQVGAEYRYWGYNTLDNKYLNISSLRADWSEENSSAPSFISNKPFYSYRNSGDNHNGISGVFELSSEGTYAISITYLNIDEKLKDKEPTNYNNITINVKWNNEEYNCRIRQLLDEYTDDGGNTAQKSYYVFGNVSSIDSNYSDTAPFLIYANYNPNTHEHGETYIISQDGSTGEVSCEFKYSYEYWGYEKLNNKYLNLSTVVYQGDNSPVTGDAVYEAIKSAIGTALGGSY